MEGTFSQYNICVQILLAQNYFETVPLIFLNQTTAKANWVKGLADGPLCRDNKNSNEIITAFAKQQFSAWIKGCFAILEEAQPSWGFLAICINSQSACINVTRQRCVLGKTLSTDSKRIICQRIIYKNIKKKMAGSGQLPTQFQHPVLTMATQVPMGCQQVTPERNSRLPTCASQQLLFRGMQPPTVGAEHRH